MKREVKFIASSKRHLALWVGGSILSSISSFKSMWITKAEYEEYGASIFHKKIAYNTIIYLFEDVLIITKLIQIFI